MISHPAVVRRLDRVEGHEEVVDDHRDAVGGQENHDDNLKPARVPEVTEESVDRVLEEGKLNFNRTKLDFFYPSRLPVSLLPGFA